MLAVLHLPQIPPFLPFCSPRYIRLSTANMANMANLILRLIAPQGISASFSGQQLANHAANMANIGHQRGQPTLANHGQPSAHGASVPPD
jgi:hypothetical protein